MNKKIGIITFHNAHNYGAVLQAYGLQETLKSMGFNVSIINYKNQEIDDYYKLKVWLPISGIPFIRKIVRLFGNLYRLYTLPIVEIRRSHFNKFIMQRFCYTNNEKESFKSIILGSDQIWNGELTGNDTTYIDGKKYSNNSNIISYAASAGRFEDNLFNNKNMIEAIKKINFISVRELSLHNKLREKLNIDSKVVLDPTLLSNEDIFKKIALKPKYNKKYILMYKLLPCNSFENISDILSKKLGLKKIKISGESLLQLFNPMYKQFATPEEYLGLLLFSEFILTTSFHGVAFSIAFRKSFYFISTGNKAENRIISLLSQLGLSDRIIHDNFIPEVKYIDYKSPQSDGTSVEQKLYALREFSQNWLKNSLES